MDTGSSASAGLLTKRVLTPDEQEKIANLIFAGDKAFDEEDFSLALDCYHRASVIDSSDANIWNLTGLAYANLEFPREAWRSFKLALVCDPDDTNTLWYASEFLFNNEDFALSRLLLERYIILEEDPERLEEARDLLVESVRQSGDDEDSPLPGPLSTDDDDADSEFDDLDGFEVEGQYAGESDDLDEDDDFSDDIYDDDSEAEFVASLGLELTGMLEKCSKCNTGLPMDAPYCYSCLAPHFYEVD